MVCSVGAKQTHLIRERGMKGGLLPEILVQCPGTSLSSFVKSPTSDLTLCFGFFKKGTKTHLRELLLRCSELTSPTRGFHIPTVLAHLSHCLPGPQSGRIALSSFLINPALSAVV